MASNAVAAYGIYPQRAPLTEVLKTLNQAGFNNEKICMMLSPTHPIATVVREAKVVGADREASAVQAGLIGWLSEFGAVVIPTVGFFIRSSEYFDAIIVRRDSMTRCGNSRTLEGLGFSGQDAERFERQLHTMGVLVYVSCVENTKTRWALELLRGTGAEEAGTLRVEEPAALQPEIIGALQDVPALAMEA